MSRQFQYSWKLARSILVPPALHRPSMPKVTAALAVTLLIVAAAAASPLKAWFGGEKTEIDTMLERTRSVSNLLGHVEGVYGEQIEPIERVLLHYRNDPRLVRRVSAALVREARRANLSPEILLAVLLVENPWLRPTAKSTVGAQGLMQVMPVHRGQWSACSGSLESIEGSICYGAQIFAENVRQSKGDMEKALLRYNGCVNGTTTPNCRAYPDRVFARAGRAAFLAWNQDR